MQNLPEVAEELRIVIGQLLRKLQKQGTSETLSWSQISAIGYLGRTGAMTVTDLAKAEGVKTQSMGATLNQLYDQNLVTFNKDSSDGRKKYFSLTTEGMQILRENRAQREGWLVTAMQSSLSKQEQETLISSIELLQRLAHYQD